MSGFLEQYIALISIPHRLQLVHMGVAIQKPDIKTCFVARLLVHCKNRFVILTNYVMSVAEE